MTKWDITLLIEKEAPKPMGNVWLVTLEFARVWQDQNKSQGAVGRPLGDGPVSGRTREQHRPGTLGSLNRARGTAAHGGSEPGVHRR